MHESRLPLIAAILLAAAPTPAQSFSADAFGTLTATAGAVSQTFGPALLPPAGVTRSAASGGALATASAGIVGDSLNTWVATQTLFGPSVQAAVDLTLTLQAPVGAGVRITIAHNSTAPGPLFNATGTVTIGSQTYTSYSTGTQVVTAEVPAGGLVVHVTHFAQSPSVTSDFDVSWVYPGVQFAGAPTPGCLGPAVCWTHGIPVIGNTAFGFTCANAHPGLGGVVAIGLGGVSVPWVYDYVDIWLDPSLPIATRWMPGGAAGDMLHPMSIPNDTAYVGLDLWAQWVLLEPSGCMPLDLSGSNAIRVTLQS